MRLSIITFPLILSTVACAQLTVFNPSGQSCTVIPSAAANSITWNVALNGFRVEVGHNNTINDVPIEVISTGPIWDIDVVGLDASNKIVRLEVIAPSIDRITRDMADTGSVVLQNVVVGTSTQLGSLGSVSATQIVQLTVWGDIEREISLVTKGLDARANTINIQDGDLLGNITIFIPAMIPTQARVAETNLSKP